MSAGMDVQFAPDDTTYGNSFCISPWTNRDNVKTIKYETTGIGLSYIYR
jgi:hypothetical protein